LLIDESLSLIGLDDVPNWRRLTHSSVVLVVRPCYSPNEQRMVAEDDHITDI